jgi:hypothetical protein
MKIYQSLRNAPRDRIASGLIAVAALFGALTLAKGASYFATGAETRGLVAEVGAQGRPDPNDTKVYVEQAKAAAEALKEKNLFVKKPPKQHPIKEVEGILGSEVLIAGKWYSVGAKIKDAEIVAIRPTEITVKWDGKEKTFAPLASGTGPSSSGGPRRPPEMRGPPPPEQPRDSGPQKVEVTVEAGDDDPLAWMGVDLPASVKEKLLGHWNSLSDEQKAEAKEQWNNMSDEQKEEALEQMESMDEL